MKVTFQGRVNGEANVRRTGGGSGSSSSRSKKIVRELRKEIRKGVRKLRRDVRKQRRELRRDVRRDFRRELYSDRFASFLRSAVSNDARIREIAEELVNEAVQVQTPAGAVSGTLVEVGDNFLTIQETPSTIVIVPFASVGTIRPL